jgi:hypothetical protein
MLLALFATIASDWTRLDAPALCLERPTVSPWMPARHIEPRWREGAQAESAADPAALWPWDKQAQLLEARARAAGEVEVVRLDGALLCRADAAALRALNQAQAEFEAEAARLWIDLEARLEIAGKLVESASGRRRILPGEVVRLGALESSPFLSGFDIEIATDAGAARPRVGAVNHGTVLSLSAVRLDGGRALRIDAWLDAARLVAVDAFDAGNADAGQLELPRLQVVQLATSAVVASGAELVARVTAASLGGEALLRVRASTRADGDGGAGWTLVDSSGVSRAAHEPPAIRPGAPWASDEEGSPRWPWPVRSPVSAGMLGAASGREKSGSLLASKAAAPTLEWSEHLLLVQPERAPQLATLRGVLEAATASQRAMGRAKLSHPGLVAELSLVPGRPARVSLLEERALPSELELEIAQESWLATPELQILADGVVVDLRLEGGKLQARGWTAASDAARTLERDAAQLARLQLAARRHARQAAELEASEEPRELLRLQDAATLLMWSRVP